MAKTVVVGNGSFGTALAIALCQSQPRVWLWGRDVAACNLINTEHQNQKYLPDINLPENLTATSDLNIIADADYVVLAIPSSSLNAMLTKIKTINSNQNNFIITTKGIAKDGRWLQQVVADFFPTANIATLVGPSFAIEVANKQLTAIVAASKSLTFAKSVAELFSYNKLKVYYQDDIIGVQLGGIIKNILAVAVGIADGAGLTSNTKAMILTLGMREASELGQALGAKDATLFGLSGLGDVILTCSDNKSRNRRFGLYIGQGLSYADAVTKVGQTIEANNNIDTLLQLANQYQVELPITQAVADVLAGKTNILDAIATLVPNTLAE